MFQFFVQVHCNPVKITFKVQERVIWNLWIWGKYFSAHFFHYFPLKSLSDLLWLPAVKIMNLGEVFLPHIYHICGGWNFWSTKDSFVEFSLNFCIKTISARTTLRLFEHLFHTFVIFTSRHVSFEEFSFSFTVAGHFRMFLLAFAIPFYLILTAATSLNCPSAFRKKTFRHTVFSSLSYIKRTRVEQITEILLGDWQSYGSANHATQRRPEMRILVGQNSKALVAIVHTSLNSWTLRHASPYLRDSIPSLRRREHQFNPCWVWKEVASNIGYPVSSLSSLKTQGERCKLLIWCQTQQE